MKNVFIISVILLFSIAVQSQDKVENKRDFTVKLPVSVFVGDFYAESMGVGLGVEKMLKEKLSLSQEISYIFHVESSSMLSESVKDIQGIKLATEIRKYLSKDKVPESGWFISTDFKNIITKSLQDVRTNESGDVENSIFRYRGVLNANVGILFYWDKMKDGRITLELLGGIGLGYIYSNSSLNVDDLGKATNYNNGKGFYPNLNIDFKIGYIIN